MDGELPEKTVECVWREVARCMNDLVGGSGHLSSYSLLGDTFEITRWEELSDGNSVWTWETGQGLDNGTLLIGHIDVPLPAEVAGQPFRRDPEVLYGEGIGCSRAPLAMLEFSLASLFPTQLFMTISPGLVRLFQCAVRHKNRSRQQHL